MDKPFATGLVVGKFAPLHKGHQLVIERAQTLCEHTVLVSYCKPELPGSEPERREQWLAACFPGATRLVVTDERLAQWLPDDRPAMPVPANFAADEVHRDFVAMLCQRVLKRRIDAVFTSEAYGAGFAAHLTRSFRQFDHNAGEVAHIMVDPERRLVPVSATQLRQDIGRHWNYLPARVAASFVRRVAVLGGESSGKSVLAAAFAEELGTECVGEYGRELWEARGGTLEFEDMIRIAQQQVRREEDAIARSRGFVICDTTPLTTLFYSIEMFGRAAPELVDLAMRPYSDVVLCAPDFPFVQDGTRRDDAFRARQHEWYEAELAARGIPYRLATAGLKKRVSGVREYLARRQ
jgi:HTH-type transcriptional repressor of NAD biosynthesis genes